MSSTYVHYSSSPGSLPSDYGLISRYNQHKGRPHREDNEENHTHNEEHATMDHDAAFRARDTLRKPQSSFSYGSTPHKPATAPGINPRLASRSRERLAETEPLLGHIPRIEEDGDFNNDNKDDDLDRAVWLNEVSKHCIYCLGPALTTLGQLWILCKYTAPVFG
jgi:hypothetical protein